MNVCLGLRRLGLALAVGLHGLLAPSACRAGPLLPVGLQPGAPVVSGSNGGLTYNAATGDFNVTLSGGSLVYAAPFVQPSGFTLFNGSLSIDLEVDKGGDFVANGTGLVLTGTVTVNGAVFTGTAADPLLTGSITAFGSDPAGPPSRDFDGYFTITGGSLTGDATGSGGQTVFGGFPLGATGGFLLSAENVTSGTLGDFSHNFSSGSVKPGVGVAVPEPGGLALLLTAAVVLGARGMRRRRRGARPAG